MFYSTLFIICKIIIIYIIHLKKPRFREVQQPIQSTQLINSIFWAELRYLNLSPDYYRKIKVHCKSTLEWEYWSPAKAFSIYFVSEKIIQDNEEGNVWVLWALSTQVWVPFFFLYYLHLVHGKPIFAAIYTLLSYAETSLINSA